MEGNVIHMSLHQIMVDTAAAVSGLSALGVAVGISVSNHQQPSTIKVQSFGEGFRRDMRTLAGLPVEPFDTTGAALRAYNRRRSGIEGSW